ncbi:MAG: hypothetical protein IVW54_10710 [Candidatus Binataceae bacterium]|nr:hypothetical protein [Candidatus Binataceae bacterium]
MNTRVEDDQQWFAEFLKRRHAEKRPPVGDEKRLLAGFYGYRGRQEIDALCGVSAFALRNFDLDYKWKAFLCEHIGEEADHGEHYIKAADKLYPGDDHWLESAEWEGAYGAWRRWIFPIGERGMPGFIMGLLFQVEGYGGLCAPIHQAWDAPEVIEWRLNHQLVDEDDHEKFIVDAVRKIMDRCTPQERDKLLATIRLYEQDLMRNGYLGDERLHLGLFIERLGASKEQYGPPLRWRRNRLWREWFGCEAPPVQWPVWFAKVGINPEA